jgi:hypothetical protein
MMVKDLRLYGMWRSDARRTRKEIDAWKGVPPQRMKKLKSLFGKLQLRFTRTRCYSTLNGSTEACRYQVVARDDTSVAILLEDAIGKKPTISHVHFEGNYFWISTGNGRLREFFRKTL